MDKLAEVRVWAGAEIIADAHGLTIFGLVFIGIRNLQF